MRGVMHDTREAREADRWRLLARVRGLRLRRRLRALADARRRERQAFAAVAAREAALERHAAQRLQVLAFCRHERHDVRDQRAGGQWRMTLRVHDDGLPALRRQWDDARRVHVAARGDAERALRDWRVERLRYDDAARRWRIALRAVGAVGAARA